MNDPRYQCRAPWLRRGIFAIGIATMIAAYFTYQSEQRALAQSPEQRALTQLQALYAPPWYCATVPSALLTRAQVHECDAALAR